MNSAVTDARTAPRADDLPEDANGGVCFHCGSPIPAGVRLFVEHDGRMKPMCCHGCQAVAQAIIDGGFDAYYAKREAAASQSAQDDLRSAQELADYDDPEFQRNFVRELPGGVREVMLSIEGIRCAACVWLNEQAVQRLAGIVEFHINLMTERATLRWDSNRLHLSEVLRAIETIGYRAYPFDRERHEAIAKANQSRMLRQLFVAGIGMMQVMMYVVPFYVAGGNDIEPDFVALMRWASLVLTLPVMLYSATSIMGGAWRDLRNRRIGMDVPVAVAIVAAFVASTWHTFTNTGEVYFDSITMFVFLLLCGRYLEFMARRRAMQGVDALLRLTPKVVARVLPDGQIERVKIEHVVVGDVLEIKSGETLAVDGMLQSEGGDIDLSMLTGESIPVARRKSDVLPAGAVNVGAPIRVEVRKVGADNMISSIQRLIERAASDRPRIASSADRIASWFLAALLVFSVVVGAVWWWLDPDRALPIVIALLVVSCPCALSLATPAALAAATGALARRGFLVARGNALEALSNVTDVVFDKTGTLTHPKPTLEALTCLGEPDRATCLRLAAALERGSMHPFARAIESAVDDGVLPVAQDIELAPGLGLRGRIDGVWYRIGSPAFVAAGGADVRALDGSAAAGGSAVYLASETSGLLAAFEFSSVVRTGAVALVAELRARGIGVHLLSGDSQQAAHTIGAAVGIEDARGDLAPEDKLRVVRDMQVQGRVVAMVGDGINDAPVLSGANVAIAMGDGAELAQISADIVLLSRDLSDLALGFQIAKQTMRVMRQNLWWSALYNGLAIPAAAFGWITPWVASVGMSLSSLLVVLNALRLLKQRPRAMSAAPNAVATARA